MLLGLAALAIPIIIHLLNRRRYEVIDWGAMRFLQMSKVTRRRLFLEEILLMLLRMGLIGPAAAGLRRARPGRRLAVADASRGPTATWCSSSTAPPA